MPPPSSTRVFLSYARSDDEAFVKRLYADLTSAGFTVWFDRESLMSRGLTFLHEIKDAIRTEVDRVVYVGGPKAALSAYVREEWQFALECDHVIVTPVLRLGDYETCVPGELGLLHCEDFRDDALYPAALAKLIASLRQPNPKLGALFAVPSLPPHFLGRPELMRRVRDALLVDLQKPQVITSADAKVGMQGMGGIGKFVLAAALARNREVRQSYPDGIIWISCGQKLTRDDLLARLRDVAKDLGGDTAFDSIPQGQGVLRELLQAEAVLLVLDDVWQSSDAQTFDVIGPRCRMLVTTRDAGILHALHGELVPVSLFTEPEALQLLADAVDCERSALPPEASEVVRECGCLPLAVALSGGMAKKRGGDFSNVLERLRRADLDKIADRASINEQHQSIWRAMQASVEVLSEDEQNRFAELSVFATDRPVPEAAVATLWSHTGHLADLDAEDLLINLAERSLVRLDEKPDADGKMRRRVSLHDLLHDYAVRVAGKPKALHQNLVDAYGKRCPDGWHTGPHDGYFFENLASHLADMEMWPECEGLVTDFPWLMRKCELGLLDSISSDYGSLVKQAPPEVARRLEIWSAFFREKAHILRRGTIEWPAHRILLQLAVEHADDSPMTIGAEHWLAEGRCDWFWLRRNRRLPHVQVSPCLAVLEGHSDDGVLGALALADGRILSWAGASMASTDKTLRLWDGKSGQCLAVLEGHSGGVYGALTLADGRILSWSWDETLRLWDGQSGQCLAVLEGHSHYVEGALALADGRILSWSSYNDNTLRLWDGKSGQCLAVLEGHSGDVKGALALANGRILSWARDNTLRLWDGQSGQCLEVVSEEEVDRIRPEWLQARASLTIPGSVSGDWFASPTSRSASLRHKTLPSALAIWNADSDSESPCLQADGTLVVTQANGQVCFLKLHHGRRRITLAEAEAILVERGDLPATSTQPSVS
ncbi:MAG: NB-ARC domain-containing protein [Verrucomicrobia bacterium]|nr:NB-ARC domain-containing protein [Verrucomicrobiota bacterium]